MADPIIAPSHRGYSEAERTDAARSANELIEQSSIVKTTLVGMIVAHQLYGLFRAVMHQEVVDNWDVEFKELVLQILAGASANEAQTKPVTAQNLQQDVLRNVVPLLDVIGRAEIDYARMKREQQQAQGESNVGTPIPASHRPASERPSVSGGGTGEPDELDAVFRGAKSPEDLQGSPEDRREDSGETGGAGGAG